MILLTIIVAILAGIGVFIGALSSLLGGTGALVAFIVIDVIVGLIIKVLLSN